MGKLNSGRRNACAALSSVGTLPSMAGDPRRPDGRAALLAEPGFRRFFLGYTLSLFGSSMATVATAFAVLDHGGDGTELGGVMAARILPIVLVLLVGGVVTDRFGARRVMPAADILRCATQTAFTGVLFLPEPPVWAMAALVAVWGLGEGLFLPGLGALVPALVRDAGRLGDANALLGLSRSVTSVAGPSAAGFVTAFWGAGAVLAADAASYGVGALALLSLTVPRPSAVGGAPASLLTELRHGWTEFRSRTWLWVTTTQMGLFNLLVWAPFLVLGPLTSDRRLGGAWAWGVIMGVYGAGAVLGGLLMLGRRPARPLVVAAAAGLVWGLPSGALAVGAGVTVTACAAGVAGVGSAVVATVYTSTNQQHVPPEVLGRVTSFGSLGAFVLGPLGLAAAGPVAEQAGAATVLAFGTVWQVAANTAVLALPAIRALRGPGPVSGTVRPTGPSPWTSRREGRRPRRCPHLGHRPQAGDDRGGPP